MTDADAAVSEGSRETTDGLFDGTDVDRIRSRRLLAAVLFGYRLGNRMRRELLDCRGTGLERLCAHSRSVDSPDTHLTRRERPRFVEDDGVDVASVLEQRRGCDDSTPVRSGLQSGGHRQRGSSGSST